MIIIKTVYMLVYVMDESVAKYKKDRRVCFCRQNPGAQRASHKYSLAKTAIRERQLSLVIDDHYILA